MIRHEYLFQAIKEKHEVHFYPIHSFCKLAGISRAAYYKWIHREIPDNEILN